MATTERTQDLTVTRDALSDALAREPWRFSFFQAVRLLQGLMTGREPIGQFGHPSAEAVRFAVHPSLSFPASEIQSLEFREGAPARMLVNFMGLTGPLAVLPTWYTELLIERLFAKDNTLRGFLDIFHHRMISLFYRAWEKHRYAVCYELGERGKLSHFLLDLVGLGTPGLLKRHEVSDETFIYYAGLFAMHSRPAVALEQILCDYFGVPVEIDQFLGAWYDIDPDALCELGEEDESAGLAIGAVVGDAIWDQQGAIRIRLGPLTLAQYADFLPGGPAHRRLESLVTFYTGRELDVQAQLVLRSEEVPACELRAMDGEGWQLGWTTWVKSAPFTRDAADTVLEVFHLSGN